MVNIIVLTKDYFPVNSCLTGNRRGDEFALDCIHRQTLKGPLWGF